MLRRYLSLDSDFLKKIAVLFSGTLVAQLVYFATSIVIARLFTPAEFGEFAAFLALVIPLAVVATGRLELAVSLTDADQDASRVLLIALSGACGCAALLALVGGLSAPFTVHGLAISPTMVWLVAGGTIVAAAFSCVNYWLIYQARFRRVSGFKVTQATSISTMQLSLGYLSASQALIVGHLLGQALTVAWFLPWQALMSAVSGIRRHSVRLVRRFWRFPLLNAPAALLNTLSGQLPVLLLIAAFDTKIAGLFALTQRVVAGPLALLSGAILDVFKEESARSMREQGQFTAEYLKTMRLLLAVGIIPMIFLGVFGQDLFAWVFGEPWREAGYFAQVMSILYFMRFVASPLSYSLIVAEKQVWDLMWQSTLLVFTVAVFVVSPGDFDIADTLLLYACGYSVLYLVNMALSFRASQGVSNAVY